MNGYYIEVIDPERAQIHEDTASYPISKTQVQENIAVIKANRAKYASDEVYLRRLQFYEDILAALAGKKA